MYRFFTLVILSVSLMLASACSKPAAAPTATPTGPTLKPPATTEDAAPADTAPGEKQSGGIGMPGPAWASLEGTDGKSHSSNDIADAQVVAVVFTCNHCPVAQAYEDRLVKFATDYKDKGVELVAINVSNLEADKLPAMKERATEKGFAFQYLFDPSQDIGRAFGATVTPHAFVLDKGRKIVFQGAIDDNPNEAAVTKHYLRDATDAALAGKMPETVDPKPVGCGIKYE